MGKQNNTPPPIREEMNTIYIIEKLTTEFKNKYSKAVKEEIIENLKLAISAGTQNEEMYYPTEFNKLKDKQPELYKFPNYFFIEGETNLSEGVVAFDHYLIYKYSEPCIIPEDSPTYGFFFGLVFSWLNEIQATDFLKYHYRCNFNSNRNEFKTFLDKISYGNKKFLSKNWLLDIEALDNLDIKLLAVLRSSLDKNKVIENANITPVSFESIFKVPDWKIYIDALHKVNNPVITSNYEFIGKTQKHKGVICSWIKDLQTKGIINKKFTRQQLATVLNNEIKNLNLGKDGKTLDNISIAYTNDYKNHLLKLANLLP